MNRGIKRSFNDIKAGQEIAENKRLKISSHGAYKKMYYIDENKVLFF
jgi:hypothetical protein